MKLRAVLVLLIPITLSAQSPSALRPTERPNPIFLQHRLESATKPPATSMKRISPVGRGALIGAGAGLAISALLTVLYVESTDSGNYSGPVLPIIIGSGAVGAIVGAAIGAGWE